MANVYKKQVIPIVEEGSESFGKGGSVLFKPLTKITPLLIVFLLALLAGLTLRWSKNWINDFLDKD